MLMLMTSIPCSRPRRYASPTSHLPHSGQASRFRYLQSIGLAQYAARRYEAAVASLRQEATYRTASRRILAASLAQLGRMDEGFARDHEAYFEAVFGKTIQSFKTPVLRTIPINRQMVADYPVAPFEDVLQIIENQKKNCSRPLRLPDHQKTGGC